MKESQIQDGFRAWLDTEGKRAGVFYVNPRFGKRSTIRADWPDFTLFRIGGILLIESKTAKGTLSDGQKALHAELRLAGIRVEVCRSVEEHVRMALEWMHPVYAVKAPETPKDALAGLTGTPAGEFFSFPLCVSGSLDTETILIDPGNGKPPTAIRLPGKTGERLGEWQGRRWLIRSDFAGNETMIRPATDADVARVTINRAKL